MRNRKTESVFKVTRKNEFVVFYMKLSMTIILYWCIPLVSSPLCAQRADFWYDENERPWALKSFLIAASTTHYNEAREIAIAAAEVLDIPLKIDDTRPHDSTGLTHSKEICEREWFSYPCYAARGRGDDSVFVSIEYSSAYYGFAEGLYIVILASGSRDDEYLQPLLKRARGYIPDAYIKTTEVYLGCMH